MATRMQQRRGTASQWVSSNAGAGPILNAGEIGWESDTNRFKIGDGVNNWASLDYFADINSTVNPAFGTSITFEGATADSYETTLQVTDPTADRTITLPNVTGTVITTGNLSDITDIGVFTSTITMEGSSADDFELTLSAGNPTADRTITFPDATGTVALTSDIAELSQDAIDTALTAGTGITKTYNDVANTLTIAVDTTTIQARVADVSDTEIGYLNGVTSAIQTQLDDKSTASKTETLTNKTLTTPTINGGEFTATGGTPRIHGIYLPEPHFITFEGATNNEFETVLTTIDPTADRTISLPDGTGTLALEANVAALSGATFTGAVSGTDLTLSGNLTVNGTTTNINSTNLVVEDKNIVLGDTGTPTDTTADGGGITLKGTTDKTFNWVDATDSWTSSEHINLASNKTLKYNGTDLVAAQSGNSGKYLTTDGTSTSWGTISGYSAPTLGSTSIASGATVTTIAGLTLSNATLSGTLTAGGGTGTSGQVLQSTGSGVQWSTPAAGAAFSELLLIGA
jgi:hypothetical protein